MLAKSHAACKLRSSHERHLTIKAMSRHLSVSIAIESDLINILYFNLNDIPWQ